MVRLQALIDRKKVIITEDTVRQALRLDDVESIDFLPNEEILTEFARMCYEKPSTKLTFYKAFFRCNGSSLFILYFNAANDTGNIVANDVNDVVAEDVPEPTPPSPIPTTTPSPPQELPSTSQIVPTPPPSPIAQPSSPPQQQQQQPSQPTTISMDLLNKKKRKLTVSGLKRLWKVGTTQRVKSSADTVMDDQEDASKQGGIIADLDADKDVTLEEFEVEEPKPLKKQAQIEQDEAYARELEAELNKNINWDDVIEQYFNSNVAFLEKSSEQLEKEESRALKRQSKSLEEKAAKKQKLDEEVKELKKHLHIVLNDEDDVYAEATPLALKVPDV
nr:hypothetical protein [Tanacetum cinerariifolium]